MDRRMGTVYMQKTHIQSFVLLTLIAVLVLSLFIGYTIASVNEDVAQASFNQLTNAARQLAREFYEKSRMDTALLDTMAALIASEDADADKLPGILGAFSTTENYLSYVELLRPDNTMLDPDGTVRDVSAYLNFDAEKQMGKHISNIKWSTRDEGERVVRNVVPVVKDGEVIYILYGVVQLSKLADNFRTGIYGGSAYVYLVDGDSGDFLLDTRQNSFGNTRDFGSQPTPNRNSLDGTIEKLARGVAGHAGFASRTADTLLYLSHVPVGINNWSVLVSVEQQHAFAESRDIRLSLYRMAAVIGVTVLVYMAFVAVILLGAYQRIRKLGMEDQSTGLKNRNAFEKLLRDTRDTVFPSLACIFLDANGLHELNNALGHAAGDQMLRAIADGLRDTFPGRDMFRIGGDEFVVLCRDGAPDACAEKLDHFIQRIEAEGYSVSYGIVNAENETGLERVIQEADDRMLAHKRTYYDQHDRRRKERRV